VCLERQFDIDAIALECSWYTRQIVARHLQSLHVDYDTHCLLCATTIGSRCASLHDVQGAPCSSRSEAQCEYSCVSQWHTAHSVTVSVIQRHAAWTMSRRAQPLRTAKSWMLIRRTCSCYVDFHSLFLTLFLTLSECVLLAKCVQPV